MTNSSIQSPAGPEIVLPYPTVEARALPPAAVAASALILTGALTGAANYYNGEHGRPEMPAIDVEWDSSQHAQSSGATISVPGKNGNTITVTDGRVPETASGATIAETKDLVGSMEEQWARQFAEDMQAGKLINPDEISGFADQVKTEVGAGWKIDTITAFGTASAEDDTVNAQGQRTAGLQETSPEAAQKQAELGDHRRDVGTLQLAGALAERGVQVDPQHIELMPSIEDVLTDAEVGIIDGMAERNGFATTTKMVEQWNREPDTVPIEVDAFLTEALAKERTFNVKVSLSRETTVEQTDGSSEHSVDVQGGEPHGGGTIDVSGNSEHHKFRLFPLLLPGYVLIGIGRKRISLPGSRTAQVVGGGEPPRNPVPADGSPRQRVLGPVETVDPPTQPPRIVRTPREQFPRPQSDKLPRGWDDSVAYRRKQPRNQNFHKRAGALAGGSGRMARSKGGNRSGRR